MAKAQKRWVYSPPKPTKPQIPPLLKAEVEQKGQALIETHITPTHVKPPPEDPQFNYIGHIYTKWFRSYFYFCAHYIVSGPNAIAPSFEAKFARLEYIGNNRFNLAAHRHNGEWIEIYPDQTLDECLELVKQDSWFHP